MGQPEFLTAKTADVNPLVKAASRGNAEARRYFATVFPPTSRCVLCDDAVGDDGTTSVMPDPTAPGFSLLMAALRQVREPTG